MPHKRRSLIVILVVYVTVAFVVSEDNITFIKKHSQLLYEEKLERTGGNVLLSHSESEVNQKLMKQKYQEIFFYRKNGFYPPSEHFFHAKKIIDKSDIFKFIQLMPKGGALHVHDFSMVDVWWLVKKVTYLPNCYMCYTPQADILFHFFKVHPSKSDCEWKTVAYYRKMHGNITDFDNMLYRNLSFVVDKPEVDYSTNTAIWKAFERCFSSTFSLVKYAPVFKMYVYQALLEFHQDNVQYIEIRCLLPEIYELDGTIHDKDWLLNTYRDITKQFIKDHPDFLGIKIIYAARRSDTKEVVGQAVKETVALMKRHSDILVGFDLVGREDTGHPLIYYLNELLYPSTVNVHLPYCFHAGETDWQGTDIDNNLIDALLLNTTRIGHGYAITKHPEAMKLLKIKDIPIEVNPISNQVLNLVTDLRNHPLSSLLAQNYPLVISSDDPALWEATGLSYDFYEAFMGLGGAVADLATLKQLALNSIKYSYMTAKERLHAYMVWDRKWDQFITTQMDSENAKMDKKYDLL